MVRRKCCSKLVSTTRPSRTMTALVAMQRALKVAGERPANVAAVVIGMVAGKSGSCIEPLNRLLTTLSVYHNSSNRQEERVNEASCQREILPKVLFHSPAY